MLFRNFGCFILRYYVLHFFEIFKRIFQIYVFYSRSIVITSLRMISSLEFIEHQAERKLIFDMSKQMLFRS